MSDAAHLPDVWASGQAYEPYVGRWSRLVARAFLDWLAVPPGARWLDVGCGTGALTETILQRAAPRSVLGLDRSEGFVAYARRQVTDPRAAFAVADAQALQLEPGAYDAAVSGLMLNFLPRPALAVSALALAVAPGGPVAAYVWDYAGQMQFMRYFWDAAAALDPANAALDEGTRFPLCQPEPLRQLFAGAGLTQVTVRPIVIPTVFRDFDDYWLPFLGGQGSAPTYAMSLSEPQRAALRERLRADLPTAPNQTIPLVARAWAVRGYASPARMTPTETVLAALLQHGLLLKQDAALPSVVGLLTGEALRTSWWSHPQARLIFNTLAALDEHPDVLNTKLLYRKDTLVHRALWPALLAVAQAREPWQLRRLPPAALSLLARLDAGEEPLRATGAPVKALEVRLLAHAHQVHTEAGYHALMLESWAAWAARAGCAALPSLTLARQRLEQAVLALGAPPKALPWPTA